MSKSIIGKGTYTTTKMPDGWKVVFVLHGHVEAQQFTVSWPSEESAKAEMERTRPDLVFATNPAFMMALQTQKLMHS
jgi:hypothetical protein